MPVVSTSLVSLLEKLKVEEPYLPPRNWESFPSQSGRFLPPTRASASPSSSSSVSESSLLRLALNALQGVESSLISIEQLSSALCSEPADRTLHKIPSLWHRLSSPDALGQILRNIGCFGSLVFLLHKFIDHFTSLNLDVETAVEGQGSYKIGENEEANNKICYTLVNQAFAIAVRKVLEGYISGLDTLCASIELRRSSNIVDGPDRGSSWLGCLTNVVHLKITLSGYLEVFLDTRELRTQIEALANICDLYDIALSYCTSPWECLIKEATTRFHGFYRENDLLTYLYSQLQIDGEIREREKKIHLIHQERNKAIDEGPDFEKVKVLHLEICHLEAKKRRQINSSRIWSRTHSAYIAGANKGTGKEMGDE